MNGSIVFPANESPATLDEILATVTAVQMRACNACGRLAMFHELATSDAAERELVAA
jgi:hypothetical protein